MESYNKIPVIRNSTAKCDLNNKNYCINFYNCDGFTCKNTNTEATFTEKDSKNIQLQISNDFKIERIIYIETYPQVIDDNFKSLWRGEGSHSSNITEVLENLDVSSSNLTIDAVTHNKEELVFFKNFTNTDSKSTIKYSKASIKDSSINFSSKTSNILHNISFLLKDEVATSDNNYGKLFEIDETCSIFNNKFYIFGKILNSTIIRVIEYDLISMKPIWKYAQDAKIKFKSIGDFKDIITVFNLDPLNKLENTEPTLCFIVNTEKLSAKIISTNSYLESCKKVLTPECLNDIKTGTSAEKHLPNVVKLYTNFVSLLQYNTINTVVYTGNILYIFRKNVCDMYDSLADNFDITDFDRIHDIKSDFTPIFNTNVNITCKQDIITQTNTITDNPIVKLKLSKTLKTSKKDNLKSSGFTIIMVIVGFAVILIMAYAMYLAKQNNQV